ncbi:MAG: NAD(P)H-hydrate dehydratase [Alphaproteobacteria bacterium]|nr:MAG: NAD(P)H-hydrate dehydratase [Alphaproteobacteria bacterium]
MCGPSGAEAVIEGEELLTAAEMRAIEQRAIASGAVSGLELMERAGAGAAEAALARWPELADGPRRAVILAGPGNNGGDGYVLARHLAARWIDTVVVAFGTPGPRAPDAAASAARWREAGGRVIGPEELGGLPAPDLVVDALFGTGLSRPFTPPALPWRRPARRLAIDIASGLSADTGRVLGGVLAADLTVTFHRRKLGHVIGEGPALSGEVVVADIGLDRREVRAAIGPQAATAPGPARLVGRPGPLAKDGGHKYRHGHVLVVAGGPARGGAARLAARAALRIGAGLVTVAAPRAALVENAARLDAIMLREADGPDELAALLADARRNAVAIGPGLGTGSEARARVLAVLGAGRATVLDADALTAFAPAPEELFRAISGPTVLTPHDGEFARLFPDLAAPLSDPASAAEWSRAEAVRAAAERSGAVVLLKGPDTLIADPEGRLAVHLAAGPRAAPWLATAGAGDVLAGLIAGLMARGRAPLRAAAEAAWLHVEAARRFGPGLIAEDLPEMLPAVLADLEAGRG